MNSELWQSLLGVPPDGALLVFGAALARLGPLVFLAPFPGGRLVPATVKTSLTLLLALLVYPQLAPQATQLAAGGLPLVAAILVKEALVGAALGFIVSLVFHAAAAAGWLVDSARGAQNGEVFLATTGGRTTALGGLLFTFTLVLFVSLGGHRLLVGVIARSYMLLPLAHFPSTTTLGAFATLCIKLTAELILLAVTLAAPVLASMLLADLALGWVNRFAPQLNVFFLAMPLKALLGIAVLALALGAVATVLPASLELALAHVEQALRLLAR